MVDVKDQKSKDCNAEAKDTKAMANNHKVMTKDQKAMANHHKAMSKDHNVVPKNEVTNYQILALVYVALIHMFIAILGSFVIFMRR